MNWSFLALLGVAGAAPAYAQHGEHSAPAAPSAQPGANPGQPSPDPHQGHEMPSPDPALHQHAPGHSGGHRSMTGALGPWPAGREASGTAWQPDASQHGGLHIQAGDWTLMGHAVLNLVHDWQEGPRGDEKTFVSGMVMAMGRRDFGDGSVLQLRAMLSPEPLMGRSGYPLHLATGETADGVTTLVDRQHPHDFFMELAASYSIRLGERGSFFLYGGLPGEPAFGPPAFMHRMSIMDSPEAPISHHWLDSTHISFGVVTAGFAHGGIKVEASRFNGREPDEERYDIETAPLDSTALRLSWNPSSELSLQASWGRFISPEQLEPDENQTRWSASGIYTRPIGKSGWWSTSLAWGRRSAEHGNLDAWVLESAVNFSDWTVFGRAEHTENDELAPVDGGGHHGPTFDVAKISLGAIRDFRVAERVRIGIGALYAFNFVPGGLEPSYGGDPSGAMAFLRIKVD